MSANILDGDSLAVPDADVARLILGRDLRPATRDRLRARGEWPPAFHVAGRAYVLKSDISAFIEAAKLRTDAARIARQEKGRRAVETRWTRHRDRVAAAGVGSAAP